jgi:hypothetical protein
MLDLEVHGHEKHQGFRVVQAAGAQYPTSTVYCIACKFVKLVRVCVDLCVRENFRIRGACVLTCELSL